ncbi:hypothetical protein [Brevundimonas sp. SORGH_AS_0993]|uniref:hypothetical protein n=1 Tax=Brevundimonas sp. SORGH_AS_0993 TaxID=3041794 RepID=UPI0027892205|nr:hypothetical protein [Brevundimonas sp. SORGH_AS_0993]MDQ1154600.1 putative membrane protein YccC [Brevundimonas sp. SORGH_AS_0993]
MIALRNAASVGVVLTAALTGAPLSAVAAIQVDKSQAAADPYRDQRILPDPSDPASRDAVLKARGEAYHHAPDSQQTPEELAETRRLNDRIAAANAAADRADAAARLDYDAALARYQIEVRRNAEQAQAAAQATRAAQERYDRDYAAWREQVRLCQSGVRSACAAPAAATADPTPGPR